MPEVTIRLALPEEIDTLVDIDDDACQLYARSGLQVELPKNHPFSVAERAWWLASAQAQRAFVAVDRAGELVGFAALGTADGRAYLDQLSVRTRAMQQGIGRRLLGRAIEWTAEHAGGVLWLTTYDHLPYNRPFYERQGFVVVPDAACGPDVAHHLAEQRRVLPAPEKRVAMRRR